MSGFERSVDYVIVGGGSAGCVVAGQLSEDPHAEVLLLELGARAERYPETLRVDGYKTAFANDALLIERFSSPQPHCGEQRLFLGSGRGVGGSGSINGMVYTRGDVRDYDAWPEGWRYSDVAPVFERLEQKLRVRARPPTEFCETFIASAERVGFVRSGNLNNGALGGVIGYETMNYEEQARRSSYVAFVKDVAPRKNLEVLSHARVRRVLFQGLRAVGVEFERDRKLVRIGARREVILCAGALESPKLLLLSGIGAARQLARFEIPVVRELPYVGKNLHDHPNVALFYLGRRPVDAFYPQLYGFQRANPRSDLAPGQSDTCYVMYPARSSLREAMMRMLPTKLPEPLYGEATKLALKASISALTKLRTVESFIARVWGAIVILGKPKSRGELRLLSRDPALPARLDPAYFSHPEDMETMLLGVRLAQRLARAEPLAQWGNTPLLPPRFVTSDAQLRWFVEHNAMTTFHYAGTCRMGSDASAVVDPELRVRGVDGLRVADASVLPYTPVSALNAPTMMVAYRAAELIAATYRSDGFVLTSHEEISA